MGVASLKPPTAVSEFQVNRTAVPGFTSVSKINLESDKGSTGVATSAEAALDNSPFRDELTDELTAAKSLLEDEIFAALADETSIAIDEETVAVTEEDADDASIMVCASELSTAASTGTLADDVMDAAEEETSCAEFCKPLIDEDCAVSITAEILLTLRLLTTDSLAEGISVCAKAGHTKKEERTKSKADEILLLGFCWLMDS